MINEGGGIWPRYKLHLIATMAILWVAVLLFAFTSNPSSADTGKKLHMMVGDMRQLMTLGGKVLVETQRAKYGSAIVYRVLSDEGWSNDLVRKYSAALLRNNWKPLPGSALSYCKEGVLAEIEPNSGTHDNKGTNMVSMVYDASSLRKCADKWLTGSGLTVSH